MNDASFDFLMYFMSALFGIAAVAIGIACIITLFTACCNLLMGLWDELPDEFKKFISKLARRVKPSRFRK